MPDHEKFMYLALEEAEKAFASGEIPVGCIIVDENENIIAAGQNTRERSKSAIGHAEISAIDAACKARGDWRLDGCTIYVTVEPCPMCTGAIINARIPCVVFGAREEFSGSCGSVIDLFSERYGHRPRVYSGVCQEECVGLMKKFFTKMREQ